MKCTECNRDLPEGSHFCPYCGIPLTGMRQQIPNSSSQPSGQQTTRIGYKRPSGKPVLTFQNKSTGVSFKMIRVDGGTFYKGLSLKKNQEMMNRGTVWTHLPPPLTLDTYYIGETVVTQRLWKTIMSQSTITQAYWKLSLGDIINPSKFKGDNLPVERVNWNDCQDFIQKLNKSLGFEFRLPTDDEWEFAARGGNLSRCYEHAGSNTFDDIGWYDSTTKEVKTKRPNELGIYDMSGNVLEWCQDGYYMDSNDALLGYVLQDSCRTQGGAYIFDAGWLRSALSSTPENEQYHIARGFYNPQHYNVLYREVLHNTIRHSMGHNLVGPVGVGFRLALSLE